MKNNESVKLRTKDKRPATSLDKCNYNHQFRIQIKSSLFIIDEQSLSTRFFANS